MGRGELKQGEPHPAAMSALIYLKNLEYVNLNMYLESFSSCAIEDNQLAEICSETLHRLLTKQSVSDRYLLGLAWTIKNLEEDKKKK